MMKPSGGDPIQIPVTAVEEETQKKLNLQFGILDNNTGTYWVGFQVTTKDIANRPLEVAQEVREASLRLFNYVRSQWIER